MDDETAPSRADQLRLYLESLRIRMDPDQFRVLGRMITGPLKLIESGADTVDADIPDEDERFLTREVRDEFLVVMGILATGRMDQQVVDLGSGITTVVSAEVAEDPVRLQELRDWAAARRRQQEETDAVLRGIEQASQDDTAE
ncbi:hypothetical protein [Peterkaempfera bronchialis]|uniref:hypothetical protein n=1 Tax=Peterkaempfera bronchialis TaxID=2126346 RepID=UPI003C2E15CE